jgi:hypothetical protein
MAVARWLVGGAAAGDAAAMMQFGLEAADAEELGIWPENANAATVFEAMSTQWTAGFSGAIGMRYEALPVVLRLIGIPAAGASRRQLFADLRVMEAAALALWAEGRRND